MTSLTMPDQRFSQVRDLTELLAAPLSPEDQTVQSMPDASPTKWHRAHTTWFFETFMLEAFAPNHVAYEPEYRMMFNSYYEAVGPRYPRPQRGVISRPGAVAVGEYRHAVDAQVVDLLVGGKVDEFELRQLVELGLQHEQQHQELILMDIKHALSLNPLQPVYHAASAREPNSSSAWRPRWLSVHGGLVEIGHNDSTFAYDNETPRHVAYVAPFRISDRLVTCAEWKAFIDDDGYRRPDLWLSDGWATVQLSGWTAPMYWRYQDEWLVYTLAGERAVRDDEPVCHVSFYEADAYARWAACRLPTEFEWEVAVSTQGDAGRPFDLDDLHPIATERSTNEVLTQAVGECWQWTSSAYLPYPGFAPAAGAVGEYNGKFMSGQMVLRGGSAFTPTGHARTTYRNFFPPHARWVLSGVRLAEGAST